MGHNESEEVRWWWGEVLTLVVAEREKPTSISNKNDNKETRQEHSPVRHHDKEGKVGGQ